MLYAFGSRLFEFVFRLLGVRLIVQGVEHLPKSGPGVIASNHIGYLDFAFVMLAPPRPRRPVRFLARSEFFERTILGFLLRRLGQIPVDVHGDPMAAAQNARRALERGELIGMHPEGTISPSFVVRRAKSGAVRLAEGAGAPLIPAGIWGSQRIMTKWRKVKLPPRGITVIVRYGEPFTPTGRTAMARTKELMERITGLVEQCQQEYPDVPAPDDAWWQPAHLSGSALTPEQAEKRLTEQDQLRKARRTSP
ncbi:MAG: lysophospholipid acyltransferase family protein [Nitriliruptoraceae bacterium]